MADPKTIDQGGPAFPELGNVAYHSDWQFENGMSLRDYHAAHRPMTMTEAYEIWSGQRTAHHPGDPGYRESLIGMGLRAGADRAGFFSWWAIMRFEYADAMIAAREAAND